MNGRIYPRVRKNIRDKQGKIRKELTVYDVQYRIRDPQTGKAVKKQKRGFMTKKEAEEFILRINTEQPAELLCERKPQTVSGYLSNWVDDYAKLGKLRPTTVSSYRMMCEKYVFPRIGNIELGKLTGQDIERMYLDLEENGRIQKKGGLSPTTVSYIHRILNEALNHAVAYRLIPANPEQHIIKKPTKNRFHAEFYTDEEVRSLLAIIGEHHLKLPVALAALCGLRRGECLGLKQDDIDFEKGCIYIRRQLTVKNNIVSISEPKTHNSIRQVPLAPEVAEMLREQIQHNVKRKKQLGDEYHDEGWLICKEDGSWINPNYLSHHFRDFLASHGFRKIRFHDLRHTYATLMLKADVPLKVVSSILGHSSITITADLYTHVMEEVKQDAGMKISKVVFGDGSTMSVKEPIINYIA